MVSINGETFIYCVPVISTSESGKTGRFGVSGYEVDPSTVGQYTGLTDKNGLTKIFEGDIVRYTFDSPDDPTATENGLKPLVGRIFWSEWRATFAVTAGRNGSSALNNDVARYVRGRSIYEYVRGANTVEVIGNIHDNPELMEDCT
jgi:uncharacterized phage protein (TIGR01671 family)